MPRVKNYTDDDIINAVKNNISKRSVLKELGLSPKGGNYGTLDRAIERLNLDTKHFKGKAHLKGQEHNWAKKIPLEEILVENSLYLHTGSLKKRLSTDNLLENRCQLCDMEPVWKGKSIVLRLDHINGINNDNRLENLRMLCPNCDSQTDTFAGRNLNKSPKTGKRIDVKKKPKPKIEQKYCNVCNDEVADSNKKGLCLSCAGKKRVGRLNRPSKETLLREIEETNFCATGRKYGVSDNAIRKWLK